MSYIFRPLYSALSIFLTFFLPFPGQGFQIKTLCESPRIYWIEELLSEHECHYLIEKARPQLKPSTVVDERRGSHGVLDPRRSSEGMFFSTRSRDKTLQAIEKRLSKLTQLPVENGEGIQVLHYCKGAEYRPHYDTFNPATPGGRSALDRGGQRVASVIMYLNEPQEGGETLFPLARMKVSPKKGCAVLFYNCLPSGEADHKTLHGGAVVKQGEKWIATKWIRQFPFQ